MLAPPFRPAPDWGDALSDALLNPIFPISHWEAMGNRFRRNYAAILGVILASWGLKLAVHPTPTASLREVISRAAIGAAIRGEVSILVVLAIYLFLFLITLEGYRRYKKRGVPRRFEWQHRGPGWYKPQAMPHLAFIITTHKDAIASRLMKELGRGVTALEGVGMYTGELRDVLLCAVSDIQIAHVEEIVHTGDPDGFVVFTQANEVRGGHFKAQEPPS